MSKATLIKVSNDDGWIYIRGSDGVRYSCQTRTPDWWSKTVGIAAVFCGEHEIPSDVIAVADATVPDRAK